MLGQALPGHFAEGLSALEHALVERRCGASDKEENRPHALAGSLRVLPLPLPARRGNQEAGSLRGWGGRRVRRGGLLAFGREATSRRGS